MSRIIVIQGRDFVTGTARCAHRTNEGKRPKMCGRKVRYVISATMLFHYFNSGTKFLACLEHGQWIVNTEASYDSSVRFARTDKGLVRVKV